MKLILVILFASIVALLPVVTSAAGNTIAANVALSSELGSGSTVEVEADTYDEIPTTDHTTYAVSNLNVRLAPSGSANYVALGMYNDYTGTRGYIQTNVASGLTCASWASPAFGGHGCTMNVGSVTMDDSSDRLVMYNIVYNQNGYWFFYLRDDLGVYWQIAWIASFDTVFSQPSLQTAINYQGAIYPNPPISTVWMHPQGAIPQPPNFVDFQTGTLTINVTNPLDLTICTSGVFGVVPMLDPHDFQVVGGTQVPTFCGGALWPRASSHATTNRRATMHQSPNRPIPPNLGPSNPNAPNRASDTLTNVNLYPQTDPLDQRSVRLGSGPNGELQTKGDIVLHLLDDPDRSEAALASWLRANPRWQNAQQAWGIPERHLLDLMPPAQ